MQAMTHQWGHHNFGPWVSMLAIGQYQYDPQMICCGSEGSVAPMICVAFPRQWASIGICNKKSYCLDSVDDVEHVDARRVTNEQVAATLVHSIVGALDRGIAVAQLPAVERVPPKYIPREGLLSP